MKSLGKIIKKKKATKNIEVLRNLLRKAPYSQPVQKLGQELSLADSADALYRYEWYKESEDNQAKIKKELNVDLIALKEEKSKTEKKSKASNKTKSKKTEGKQNKSKNGKKSNPNIKLKTEKKKSAKVKQEIKKEIAKSKKKGKLPKKENTSSVKSKKSNKNTNSKNKAKAKGKKTGQLDDYTIWLNSLSKDKAAIFTKSKKVKKKKVKAKSKKDNLKSDLKKKISDSTKSNKKIASKSLAKLYAKEGHYKKAIKVYEELSLKNPKKSSFFAAQIEKLKNKK